VTHSLFENCREICGCMSHRNRSWMLLSVHEDGK